MYLELAPWPVHNVFLPWSLQIVLGLLGFPEARMLDRRPLGEIALLGSIAPGTQEPRKGLAWEPQKKPVVAPSHDCAEAWRNLSLA